MAQLSVRDLKIEKSVIGASESATVISYVPVDSETSLNFRIDMVVADVTSTTGITARLQHKALGGSYANLATTNSIATITAAGTYSIVLHVERSADMADLPLRQQTRLVVTTGTGDAVTFSKVSVQGR